MLATASSVWKIAACQRLRFSLPEMPPLCQSLSTEHVLLLYSCLPVTARYCYKCPLFQQSTNLQGCSILCRSSCRVSLLQRGASANTPVGESTMALNMCSSKGCPTRCFGNEAAMQNICQIIKTWHLKWDAQVSNPSPAACILQNDKSKDCAITAQEGESSIIICTNSSKARVPL